MIKPILQENDSLLRTPSIEIHVDGPSLGVLKTDMLDTLRNEKYGVALSAIQIGSALRMFLIERKNLSGAKAAFYINPTWEPIGEKKEKKYESCLSINKALVFAEVERYYSVRVEYLGEKGERVSKREDELKARIIQHEVDHLNGVLFTDIADLSTKKDLKEYLTLLKGKGL